MAPSTAVQLKEEGNALFVKKHYARAHEKYSEAIAIDGQNAATDLDPTYAKGWSRLASAHDAGLEFTSAVVAWQKALDALPKVDLSPAELKQKEQYTTSLQKATERLEAATKEALPGDLQASGPAGYNSSVRTRRILISDFTEGVGYMNILKKVPMKGGPQGYAIIGHTEGLTCITNGVMRDLRVFRIDCQDWLDKYNDQVCFEAEKRRAWTSESLEGIQKAALQRLKKEGWHDVRPALSVVVRGWIMRAIFDSELRQVPQVAVERLKETLELLHWGRQIWRDVSKDDRGAIFENTFVRGVKSIYLETLMAAHEKATGPDKTALLDTLLAAARELIDEMQNAGQPTYTEPVDPGFVSSFHIYPVAEAHAEKHLHYTLAVGEYTEAARMLPPDDEKHCWYLNCTIDPLLRGDAPKKVVMGVVNMIRAAMPLMQRIWAHSALAKQGRDAMIETTLRVAESKHA
ncbi:hypothetical protein OG21DRAFT_1476945 [Imleria badia]|nr:hypothetical protein OG21DRAFT_1476945 [Imleria badia]